MNEYALEIESALMNADKTKSKRGGVMTKTPVPYFISFSGKKQTGKDTAVKMATEMLVTHGKRVTNYAFADPIKKEICITILGLDKDLVYGTDADKETLTQYSWDTFPEYIRSKYSSKNYIDGFLYKTELRTGPMSYREVMQIVGTDIFREMFDMEVWTKTAFRKDWSGYDVVFFTDCRFPNEKRVTEQSGGTIIRLERETGLEDEHLSETALDEEEFEYLYKNNGSFTELKDFVRDTLRDLGLLNGQQ